MVSAYVPVWSAYDSSFALTNLTTNVVTHLIYAFARPAYDIAADTASISLKGVVGDHAESRMTAKEAIETTLSGLRRIKAEQPKLKVLVSVGGWGLSRDFSNLAASDQARKTFVTSCMELLITHQFDGIDIDWEFPVEGGSPDTIHRPDDAENLVLLLEQLRRRLDVQAAIEGRPYLLTLAVPGEYRAQTQRYQLTASSEVVDWFHLMAYDFAGSWQGVTGHNAPLRDPKADSDKQLSVHGAVQSLLTNGVPRNKIVVGVSLSGRRYVGVNREQLGLHQPFQKIDTLGETAGSNNYHRLAALIETSPAMKRYWDHDAQAAYLFDREQGIFISFDDPQSIRAKWTYVRDQDLRGVMCWSIDKDAAGFPLVKSLYRGLFPSKTQYLQ